METLKIIVEGILYPSEAEDATKRNAGERRLFYVLQYATEAGAHGKAKGELPYRPMHNERLTLKGEWTEFNGTRQFRWRDAAADVPVDERAMLKYACELTSGIGPKLEAAIWEAKKEGWRQVEASDVKGLTAAKVSALRDVIDELESKKEQAEAVAFLLEHHATVPMANAAWEKWERQTVPTVRGDCYALCDLPGYGFQSVDVDIRKTFAVEDDDPRRVRSAIRYCMRLLTERGDTCVPWYLLFGELGKKLPGVPEKLILEHVQAAVSGGMLDYFFHSQMISLHDDYKAEETIWTFAKDREACHAV